MYYLSGRQLLCGEASSPGPCVVAAYRSQTDVRIYVMRFAHPCLRSGVGGTIGSQTSPLIIHRNHCASPRFSILGIVCEKICSRWSTDPTEDRTSTVETSLLEVGVMLDYLPCQQRGDFTVHPPLTIGRAPLPRNKISVPLLQATAMRVGEMPSLLSAAARVSRRHRFVVSGPPKCEDHPTRASLVSAGRPVR